jgi:hypothetical protein
VPRAISAEEAIEILVRSYELTGRRQEVKKEVAEIRKQVSK